MEGRSNSGLVRILVCKYCKQPFQIQDEFFAHKKARHSDEIQRSQAQKHSNQISVIVQNTHKRKINELDKQNEEFGTELEQSTEATKQPNTEPKNIESQQKSPADKEYEKIEGFRDSVAQSVQETSLQESTVSTTVDIREPCTSSTLPSISKDSALKVLYETNKKSNPSLLDESTAQVTSQLPNSSVPSDHLVPEKPKTVSEGANGISTTENVDTEGKSTKHYFAADSSIGSHNTSSNNLEKNLTVSTFVENKEIKDQISPKSKCDVQNQFSTSLLNTTENKSNGNFTKSRRNEHETSQTDLNIKDQKTKIVEHIQDTQNLPSTSSGLATITVRKILNCRNSAENDDNASENERDENVVQPSKFGTATLKIDTSAKSGETHNNKKAKLSSPGQPLKCSYCPKILMSKSGKIMHERTHTHLIKCTDCKAKFVTRAQLEEHFSTTNCSEPQNSALIREAEIRKVVGNFCNSMISTFASKSVLNPSNSCAFTRPQTPQVAPSPDSTNITQLDASRLQDQQIAHPSAAHNSHSTEQSCSKLKRFSCSVLSKEFSNWNEHVKRHHNSGGIWRGTGSNLTSGGPRVLVLEYKCYVCGKTLLGTYRRDEHFYKQHPGYEPLKWCPLQPLPLAWHFDAD